MLEWKGKGGGIQERRNEVYVCMVCETGSVRCWGISAHTYIIYVESVLACYTRNEFYDFFEFGGGGVSVAFVMR